MSNIELFIKPLLQEFEQLGASGFRESKKGNHESLYMHRWERCSNWKKEIVQLVYPQDDPNYCRIDFQVYLIAEEREYILTGISLSKMANNSSDYRFPTLFKKARSNDFVKTIIKQLLETIGWFDKFKDKKSCLSIIQTANPNDNIAIAPTGNKYQIIEKMLNSHD